MRSLLPALRPRPLRARRVPMLLVALLFGALVMPSAAASPVPAAGTSLNTVKAVIAPGTYGGQIPATVTFNGSGSYCVELCSIASWSWNFGDGATGTGAVASHTYTTSGNFTVTLTVASNEGVTDTVTTQLMTVQQTIASFTMTPSAGVLPVTASFDASASSSNWDRPIVSYAWDFGDGTTGTGRLTTHTYTTPGVRYITLTVTDSMGTIKSTSGAITVQDPLLAPNNLRATSPAKGITSLTWTNRTVMVTNLTVERCTGSTCTNFVAVGSVSGAYTSFGESGLRSGTTLRYRVRATSYLGTSVVSSSVSVKVR